MMNLNSKIFVAGHRGLVGSALTRRLSEKGYSHVITRPHSELDLMNTFAVADFFSKEKPEYVFLAAAKVGGIHANNTYPAEFIFSNLTIQTNVIHQSYIHGVKRLLFLGSSCIYPRLCAQPMKESYLMTGPLEKTNSPYAVAKIAGIEICWSYNRQYGTQFIPVMPTNLYGPYDNFNIENSHVLPALIRKFHLAKLAMNQDFEGIKRDERAFGPIPDDLKEKLGIGDQVSGRQRDPELMIWGTGTPKREFLHVDDLADACIYISNLPEKMVFATVDDLGKKRDPFSPLINIGMGKDQTIKELAEMIQDIIGVQGELTFDASKPDGAPQKLLDVSLMNRMNWRYKIELTDGIKATYDWYKSRYSN